MGVSKIKDIETAKRLVLAFKDNLPKRVDPASLTLNSKLPFKAVSLREVILYRMTELGEVAIELFEKKKMVSAFIIVRAASETVAMLYWLHKKMKNVVVNQKVGDIDDFLMKVSFGRKDDKELPEPYNILTAIKHIDKEFKGFEGAYNSLSEFAHPNWSGCSGSYSRINKKNVWLDLGTEVREVPLDIGLSPLIGALEIFYVYYAKIGDLIPDFIKICDDDIARKQT